MIQTTAKERPGRVHTIEVSTVAPSVPGRLHSLDVFRGITLAGMLLVNDPGSWDAVYPPLEHSVWNGVTPTDLVFPFFIFIVGVSMVFSFGKLLEKGVSRGEILLKSAKRAAMIFLIGLALASYPWIGFDWSHIRIPGVLQRIALSFLLASVVYLTCRSWRSRVAVVAVLLLGYWAVEMLVPVPGVGAGVLVQGKDISSYVDRAVFGMDHMWRTSRVFDPEGLLGMFPSAANVLLGVFAGEWLRSRRPSKVIVQRLLIAGVLSVALGSLWGQVFPLNKALWTSPFVLFTAGLACIGLALCYWLVDVKGWRGWTTPFVIFGVNAIAAYALSHILAHELERKVGGASIQERVYGAFTHVLSPLNASVAFAICFVLLCMAVMSVLYRRKIYIRV
jgi:predicted acyltransferase